MEAIITNEELFMQSLHKRKIAVVVAHPDDESLWFGNLISRYYCDIYCCMTPKQDPRRAFTFFEVCKKTGGYGFLLPDFEMDWINLQQYEVVFTHNENGEYGHEDHKFVNRYVTSNFDGKVVTSGYGGESNACLHGDKSDLIKTYNYDWHGRPRYEVLFKNWGTKFDLKREEYNV